MPRVIAEQFHTLISVMEDIVEQATEPVTERLRTWSKQQSPEDISRWELPELIHAGTLISPPAGREAGRRAIRPTGT